MPPEPINPLTKRIALILGGLLLAVGIAAGVVFALKNFVPKASNSLTPIQINPISPEEVMAAYTAEAITGLKTYEYQADATPEGYIVYRAGNYAYTIHAPTNLQVMFYAKEKGQSDDRKDIDRQTATFMQAKGYDKINNTGSANTENPVYFTYASTKAVCQLVSGRPADNTTYAYYSLNCAEKSAIEQEYAATEKLLDLYKQTEQLPAFNEALRTNKTEDNKAFSIISLQGDDQHLALLFAAISDNWSYIGDLSGTGESNGKYSLTPALRTAINDSKYGDFLKKNIQ